MDDELDFAQSRQQQELDLFGDDFEPAEPTVLEDNEVSQATSDVIDSSSPATVSTPISLSDHAAAAQRKSDPAPRGPRNGGTGRSHTGRGANHQNHTNHKQASIPKKPRGGGLAASRFNTDKSASSTPPPAASPPKEEIKDTISVDSTPEESTANSTPAGERSSDQNNGLGGRPVPAVRGDRSGTGGVKKPKLTEAELEEKLAAMAILSARKTESFARAAADQANFQEREQQREQQQAAKRQEDRRALRQQDMERAKNRERKLRAQGGREWDSAKTDADVVDGRVRGAGAGYARARDDDQRPASNHRAKGADGHRSGGSGGAAAGPRPAKPEPQSLPTPQDFPALPAPAAKEGTWAEEVAAEETA